MPVRRVAILSVHTSPLAQPGSGDGGGMNVYVRALAGALTRAGVECDVFTRREDPHVPAVTRVEEGFRVVHIDVGPPRPIPLHDLTTLVDPFVDAVLDRMHATGDDYDVLHANYWVSGAVGHRLKHALDRPLVATFHTLARVKAEAGFDDEPEQRARLEHEVVDCADLMLASTAEERDQLAELYGAEPSRVEIVPPGVDHSVFRPDPRAGAALRGRLGLDGRPLALFVGRIQPLKGADVALRALAGLPDDRTTLLVVGGPSGPSGAAESARLERLVAELGLDERVRFVPPQPHDGLADFYRAADVCVVPSRSESFGLVALEAAACGTPVVAAAVGGLRSLVDDGVTGFLVDGHDPAAFAARVEEVLANPLLAAEMGEAAVARSGRYSWSITAARLRRSYGDLVARSLVQCR
ncbi:MAG TPA: glycosyltransferase [Acidimicrobiia bacterium]|nr:glycosyltransferase [Acidimicrobiia bacterium]